MSSALAIDIKEYTICNFLISEQKCKVWVLMFLNNHQKYFGKKIIRICYKNVFPQPCQAVGRQTLYATAQ